MVTVAAIGQAQRREDCARPWTHGWQGQLPANQELRRPRADITATRVPGGSANQWRLWQPLRGAVLWHSYGIWNVVRTRLKWAEGESCPPHTLSHLPSSSSCWCWEFQEAQHRHVPRERPVPGAPGIPGQRLTSDLPAMGEPRGGFTGIWTHLLIGGDALLPAFMQKHVYISLEDNIFFF